MIHSHPFPLTFVLMKASWSIKPLIKSLLGFFIRELIHSWTFTFIWSVLTKETDELFESQNRRKCKTNHIVIVSVLCNSFIQGKSKHVDICLNVNQVLYVVSTNLCTLLKHFILNNKQTNTHVQNYILHFLIF